MLFLETEVAPQASMKRAKAERLSCGHESHLTARHSIQQPQSFLWQNRIGRTAVQPIKEQDQRELRTAPKKEKKTRG